MKRSRFLVISTAAGVTAVLDPRRIVPAVAGPALRNYGADDERAVISRLSEALSPSALAGSFLAQTVLPPATRRVLAPLPPVSFQGAGTTVGSPGSCTSQSWGYALGSYTSAIGTARDLSDPENQASAAWLYKFVHSQVNKTCPNGSPGRPYLEHLVSVGAPSNHDFPYDPDPSRYTTPAELCTYLNTADPSRVYGDESHFLIGSYKYIPSITGKRSTYLPKFKEWIDAGHIIAFAGQNHTTNDYEGTPTLTSRGVYVPPELTVPPVSTHCQVVVGYDDDLGALLVQNSFGEKWNSAGPLPGGNGRIWWSYDRFFEYQMSAAVGYPNVKAPGPGTPLHASAPGGPAIAVHTTGTFADEATKRSGLRFDLTAEGPAYISNVHVTGPKGGQYSSLANQTIRAGYVYVTRAFDEPFRPGKYELRLTVIAGTQALRYSGKIEVSA